MAGMINRVLRSRPGWRSGAGGASERVGIGEVTMVVPNISSQYYYLD